MFNHKTSVQFVSLPSAEEEIFSTWNIGWVS